MPQKNLPRPTLVVSSDPRRLDFDFVCAQLKTSYWAAARPRTKIRKSLRNSVCYGVYEKASGRQVAFARLVTDGVTFSWLCDVIVDERCRGQGVGTLLLKHIFSRAPGKNTMCLLGTRDAHEFYRKIGFNDSAQMKRLP